MRPDDAIHRIRYFTARVSGSRDPGATQRQDLYLRALSTLPEVVIHYGLFLTTERRMPLANGEGYATVLRTEEKGSDVNLASYLLLDAFRGESDLALVISNDSALVEPLRLVRSHLHVQVGVVLPVMRPRRKPSVQLADAATFVREIRNGARYRRLLAECQFPDELTDAGGSFRKPADW